jgi:hypothetical protein
VGDATASVTAAATTHLLKDGMGQVGSILFASWQGSDLDNDAKQFRLLADVLNDVAMLLDLLSPLWPGAFVAIACLASLLRAVVGVAGGATRAALRQHQARSDNMGDVSAKDGSQETLVNFFALLVNLWLIPLVNDHQVGSSRRLNVVKHKGYAGAHVNACLTADPTPPNFDL